MAKLKARVVLPTPPLVLPTIKIMCLRPDIIRKLREYQQIEKNCNCYLLLTKQAPGTG
jgi:hypothetical protein